MYSELFESIIQASSENTDNIEDSSDIGNFYARISENLLFERVLKESEIIDFKKSLADTRKNVKELLRKNPVNDNDPKYYSDENFDTLFKNGIKTPLDNIVIPSKVLKQKQRKHKDTPLSFIIETLENPKVILKSSQFDESLGEVGRRLYISSFSVLNKEKPIIKYVLVICAQMKTGNSIIISGYFIKRDDMIEREVISPDAILFPKNEGTVDRENS